MENLVYFMKNYIVRFIDWLFNRIQVGNKYRTTTDLLNDTELIATITSIKNKTVVYNVSINGIEHTNVPRVNSIKRFKKIYKERL